MGAPIASRTRLGWIVRGVIGVDDAVPSARILAALAICYNYDELASQVKRFCDTDAFGSEHKEKCISDAER